MENNGLSRSTTQACAACKYQRRKCGSTCILAPYFPHDRQKQFLNAHRLFGVGKISKMLKDLDQSQRDVAMNSIMYESDMRARNPVGGCLTLVQQLQAQIDYATAELQLVHQNIAYYRSQNNTSNNVNDDCYVIMNGATPVYVEQQMSQEQQRQQQFEQQQQQQQMSHEQQRQQQFEQQQQLGAYNVLQEDVNMWTVQDSVLLSPLIQEPVIDYDYKPMLDLMDKVKLDARSSHELNQPP